MPPGGGGGESYKRAKERGESAVLCSRDTPRRWTTPDPAKSRKTMGGVGIPLKVSTVWLRKREALGVPLQ